jgi:DNA-directed RNA polymerase specialized sigma subunit
MTIAELQKKRAEFKARVREYLKDSTLSYREIGNMVGVSGWRICQIRKELGIPRRVGGRRTRRTAA